MGNLAPDMAPPQHPACDTRIRSALASAPRSGCDHVELTVLVLAFLAPGGAGVDPVAVEYSGRCYAALRRFAVLAVCCGVGRGGWIAMRQWNSQ
jgi:hypothetical protein